MQIKTQHSGPGSLRREVLFYSVDRPCLLLSLFLLSVAAAASSSASRGGDRVATQELLLNGNCGGIPSSAYLVKQHGFHFPLSKSFFSPSLCTCVNVPSAASLTLFKQDPKLAIYTVFTSIPITVFCGVFFCGAFPEALQMLFSKSACSSFLLFHECSGASVTTFILSRYPKKLDTQTRRTT